VFSAGIRNPRRSLLICIAITLAACASIAWGAYEMQVTGQDTLSSGLKIGLALLPAMLAPAMAWNFWRGMQVFAAIRRGEKEIARWTVTAAELAEFTASDKALNALRGDNVNDWSPPREPPASGLDVIFVADGVLVGDTYFALVTTGLFRFTGVRMLIEGPPVIAFRTLTTYANRFGTRTTVGELRIPVSRLAGDEVMKVVAHFKRVGAHEIIVNPDFYRSRVRFGLIAAPICFAVAAVGFLLGATEEGPNSFSIPTVMFAGGITFGIAALILALAAGLMSRAQRRKR